MPSDSATLVLSHGHGMSQVRGRGCSALYFSGSMLAVTVAQRLVFGCLTSSLAPPRLTNEKLAASAPESLSGAHTLNGAVEGMVCSRPPSSDSGDVLEPTSECSTSEVTAAWNPSGNGLPLGSALTSAVPEP